MQDLYPMLILFAGWMVVDLLVVLNTVRNFVIC